MKEKLKNYLFGISIFYSTIIILLITLNTITSTNTIELYDLKENKTKLNEYKNEISLLEQNSCTTTINQIINYYEKTSYNGEVDLKKFYNQGLEESILSLYMNAKENCNLTEDDIEYYNFPTKVLATTIWQEELLKNHYFQYELTFKDIFTRSIVEPEISNIEYKISKNLQLEIIRDLIEFTNKEEI